MKLRFVGLAAAAAAAVAIAPTSGLGQSTALAGASRAAPVGDRVVVAEVRESRCKDGTRSVRVKLLDAGEQPAEVRVVDSQGYEHTYVLSAHPKRESTADRGCAGRWPERGPIFPWY